MKTRIIFRVYNYFNFQIGFHSNSTVNYSNSPKNKRIKMKPWKGIFFSKHESILLWRNFQNKFVQPHLFYLFISTSGDAQLIPAFHWFARSPCLFLIYIYARKGPRLHSFLSSPPKKSQKFLNFIYKNPKIKYKLLISRAISKNRGGKNRKWINR